MDVFLLVLCVVR